MADQAQKDSLLAALAGLGGSAGNGKLREALGWDEATCEAVKQALVDDGAIVPGRGRGGSVAVVLLDQDCAYQPGDRRLVGKMLTAPVRRLTSSISRSSGLVECSSVRCWLGAPVRKIYPGRDETASGLGRATSRSSDFHQSLRFALDLASLGCDTDGGGTA